MAEQDKFEGLHLKEDYTDHIKIEFDIDEEGTVIPVLFKCSNILTKSSIESLLDEYAELALQARE